MLRNLYRVVVLLGVFCSAGSSIGVVRGPLEMAEARRWTAAKFEGRAEKIEDEPGLLVLENHGPVQVNARGGEPLRIGAKQYTKGLYCHASSKIVVRLKKPGKLFTSEIG